MKTLVLCSLLLCLCACGNKKKSSSGGGGTPEVVVDPIHTRPLEITQIEAVHFHRKEQMTSRYDCAGLLESRNIETLNYLSEKLTINYVNRKKASSYSVYNRRTRSQNKGFAVSDGKFIVDYAPTVFNMRVKEGMNDIEYIFNKCIEYGKNPQGERICLKEELEKEGMIQVDVTYSSEEIPTERHIYRTPESCKP
jgi:hypothetical protein